MMIARRRTFWDVLQHAETLIMLVCCGVICASKAEAAPVVLENEVIRYLSQFGYLHPVDPGSEEIISKEAMFTAIAEFQDFAGINITGNVDPETAELMILPRCGVKDIIGQGSSGRSRRYAFIGKTWPRNSLTYKIGKYSRKLYRRDVDQVIAKAFAVWSKYTNLRFSSKSGQVDIEIRFERRRHGDGNPFDGPASRSWSRNALAHASSPGPGPGGDIHFDDDEKWTINNDGGIDLFQVAAHEIGHSLGLRHSRVRGSLMFPFYHRKKFLKLHNDDIAGIQALYGSKTVETVKNPQICRDPKIDTIFTSATRKVYVFKGKLYWKLMKGGIAARYPKLITATWKELPSDIDAAYTGLSGKTYFFKGSMYWKYEDRRMDEGFPKKISQGFPGIPVNIDAVTMRRETRKIYFFKGTKYWRYDPDGEPHVKSTYPKSISVWRGLPSNLDAAVTGRRYTYFFKGSSFYRVKNPKFSVDRSQPYLTGPTWFGCR